MADDSNDLWIDILGTGHIKKKILKPPKSGIRPEKGDICKINYDLYAENGTIVDSKKDFELQLGDLEINHGLDLALALMEIGEQSEVMIGPRFAYGNLGLKSKVAPNETIKYIIDLIDVTSEPPTSEISLSKRISIAQKKKERGNWWYARSEYTFAILCYRRALDYLHDPDIHEPDEGDLINQHSEERLKTYNNLAAAQMKVKALDGALISVSHVLISQPDNIKGLYRKAKILREMGKLEESIGIIKAALLVEPESQSLNLELCKLLTMQRENNHNQKKLFMKMLGNSEIIPKKTEEKEERPKSYATSWRWLALISIAAVVLGSVVAVKYREIHRY